LPVRQWVLAVPQRLRYFLERDAVLQGAALRLFLAAVEQCLRAHCPGSGRCARIGAIAFIHSRRTAVVSRSTARCASRLPTAPGANGCCATLARSPFALERRHELGLERLLYAHPQSNSDRGGTTLVVTPLELLDRLAALVPPPRVHRQRAAASGGDRNGHHATPAATGPEAASPRTSTTACRPLRLGAAARAHL
jgi:hypothetical protein